MKYQKYRISYIHSANNKIEISLKQNNMSQIKLSELKNEEFQENLHKNKRFCLRELHFTT